MMSLPPVSGLEAAAMTTTAVSVWLAARRHITTWPLGIIGCVLYGALYARTQLYADATLQVFFVLTSLWGWWHWRQPQGGPGGHDGHAGQRPRLPMRVLMGLAGAGLLVTLAYGALLKTWSDAYAPFWDSAILATSVIAQLLLMQARRETWPCWLIVNTLSVPLFYDRELYLTAGLYALFWFNAWHGWWAWSRPAREAA